MPSMKYETTKTERDLEIKVQRAAKALSIQIPGASFSPLFVDDLEAIITVTNIESAAVLAQIPASFRGFPVHVICPQQYKF